MQKKSNFTWGDTFLSGSGFLFLHESLGKEAKSYVSPILSLLYSPKPSNALSNFPPLEVLEHVSAKKKKVNSLQVLGSQGYMLSY